VTKPVADQLDFERISVCSFNHANQDLIMAPLLGEGEPTLTEILLELAY
jgi:hypothetical protein